MPHGKDIDSAEQEYWVDQCSDELEDLDLWDHAPASLSLLTSVLRTLRTSTSSRIRPSAPTPLARHLRLVE